MKEILNTELINGLKEMTDSLNKKEFIHDLFENFTMSSSYLLIEIWSSYKGGDTQETKKHLQCLCSKCQIVGASILCENCRDIMGSLDNNEMPEAEDKIKHLPRSIEEMLHMAELIAG